MFGKRADISNRFVGSDEGTRSLDARFIAKIVHRRHVDSFLLPSPKMEPIRLIIVASDEDSFHLLIKIENISGQYTSANN